MKEHYMDCQMGPETGEYYRTVRDREITLGTSRIQN